MEPKSPLSDTTQISDVNDLIITGLQQSIWNQPHVDCRVNEVSY